MSMTSWNYLGMLESHNTVKINEVINKKNLIGKVIEKAKKVAT